MKIMEIKDNIVYETTNIDKDKEVIVHCTNFFPKDGIILCNYDGNKTGSAKVKYDGVAKEVESLNHRHTTHFVRNGVVESTGDGYGNWKQPKYIIIDLLNSHFNQFISLTANDSYTNGSVKLSDKAIILVRSDCYDEIPVEQYSPFTVMKYEGDYVKCVKNVFNILGIKERYIDENGAGHANSFDYCKEQLLNKRNLYINYLNNNSWNGKSDIFFDEEQLFFLFDIANENHYFDVGASYSVNLENMEEEFKFYMLLQNMGIQKRENGFSFKSESDMISYYDHICKKGSLKEEDIIERFNKLCDFSPEEALHLYMKYLLSKRDKQIQANGYNINMDDINKMMTSDLYDFAHHQEAKIVTNIHYQKKVPVDLIITKKGIKLDGCLWPGYYDLNYVSNNINGKFDENGNFYFTYFINNDVKSFFEIDDYISNIILYSVITYDESGQTL